MNSESLLKEAEQLNEVILKHRRYLHTHPGTGFDIEATKAYVQEQLSLMGYDVQECGKRGLVCLAGGKMPGKVFLLRADMDALPIIEEADVEFKSTNGKMHACGHDMHTSMLLGAAQLLKNHEDEIQGTVKLMFQPAEEIFEGSKDMIENGILENPKVDAACMIHVIAAMPFPAGTILVSAPGVSAPAADYFTIKVQGKGCHGSSPNTGIDPLVTAAHILIALQEIQTRELPLSAKAVLTFGTMHAGHAENVIPDTAVMGGTIRTYDENIRAVIKQRMIEITQGMASAYRCSAEVILGSGCPCLTNDKALSISMTEYMKELLGEKKAFSVTQLKAMAGSTSSSGAGSEDFAYISQEIPSIMLALAAGQPELGYPYPQHHPKVKFDESVLPIGSAVYTYAALRWLEENN